MNPKLKNIILFGGIFILLVAGYFFFFGGNNSATPALTTTGGRTGASTATSVAGQSAVGKEFLTTLLNLRNIKLDDSIFTDPTFASLQDFELSLIQETNPGRPNPFLPLGVDASIRTPASSAGAMPVTVGTTGAATGSTGTGTSGTVSQPNTPSAGFPTSGPATGGNQ